MNRTEASPSSPAAPVYDCIIIGAGPGGLQAAIYLGRYNRRVLLVDRGGGRTAHARSIENFLTQKTISGKTLIELGMEQARNFNVTIEKAVVTSVKKIDLFEVSTRDKASGVHAFFWPPRAFTIFCRPWRTCLLSSAPVSSRASTATATGCAARKSS